MDSNLKDFLIEYIEILLDQRQPMFQIFFSFIRLDMFFMIDS